MPTIAKHNNQEEEEQLKERCIGEGEGTLKVVQRVRVQKDFVQKVERCSELLIASSVSTTQY